MRAALAFLVPAAAIALTTARPAEAFCRSTTCADADCPRDLDGCKKTGAKLFWKSSCAGFSIQKDGTVNLPMSAVKPVIEASFFTWTGLSCPGGHADISFGELAEATCHEAHFNADGPNANVVMFQDAKWRYTDVSNTLAKTTVSFDTTTGEIWDADIELNYAYNEITVGDDHVVYDLQSLLTHEIGHFIGLDHSLDVEATMNPDYEMGTIYQRTLAPDDLHAVCAAYPASRGARCSTTPRGGFVAACEGDPAPKGDPGGCSFGAGEEGAGGAGVLLAIAAFARARRRRRGALALSIGASLVALSVASCGKGEPPNTLCDAGAVTFCICPDGEDGTHECNADGKGFKPCRLQSTGEMCPDHMPTTSSTGPGGDSGGSGSGGGPSSSSGGTTGGGGTTSSGGGGPIGQCPGIPASVDQGNDTNLAGDTSDGADGELDRCGGDLAPEVVYQVTPQGSGTLVVTVNGMGQADPVVYARTGDCETGVSLGCTDQTVGGGTETLTVEAVSGTPIWVFVDGFSGTSGPYALNLHLQGGVPGDTCPGVAIALDPGDPITAGGDTSIAAANYKGTGACSASGTKEIVYAVTPSADGTLTVTLDPGFDAQLYAREGSCTSSTSGTQLGCSDMPGSGSKETIAFPAVAGTRYSVFVDGATGEAGPYTIEFDLE